MTRSRRSKSRRRKKRRVRSMTMTRRNSLLTKLVVERRSQLVLRVVSCSGRFLAKLVVQLSSQLEL